MAISVECDECFTTFQASDKLAGKRVRCKDCQAVIRVPGSNDEFEDYDDEPTLSRSRRTPARKGTSARRKKSGKRKARRASGGRKLPIGIPALIATVFFGLLFIWALAVPRASLVYIVVAGLGAVALYMAGWLGTVIKSFQDGAMNGLACLFVFPLYFLYAAATDWENYSGPVKAIVGAILLMVGIVIVKPAGGWLPMPNSLQGLTSGIGNDPTEPFSLGSAITEPPVFGNVEFKTAQHEGYVVHDLIYEILKAAPREPFSNKHLGTPVSAADKAAAEMQMRVYLPSGEHQKESLPCVLVPPAGTTLLSGIAMDEDPANPEHLPYVRAGYCVITFSLDGVPFPGEGGSESPIMPRTYRSFVRSYAGLINVKTAWGLAQTIPAVNKNQIFMAGHSSAGTLALLFSAHATQLNHTPPLAGCIAYAPESDVELALGDYVRQLGAKYYQGGPDFVVRSSPKTHAAGIECPVFLFHSAGDQVTPFSRSQAFHDQLQSMNKEVTLVRGNGSDHYQTMIDEGIPAALKWLEQRREKLKSESPPTTTTGTKVAGTSPDSAKDKSSRPVITRLPGWKDDRNSDNPVGIRPARPQDELSDRKFIFFRDERGVWRPHAIMKVLPNGDVSVGQSSRARGVPAQLKRTAFRISMTAADVPKDELIKKEFTYEVIGGPETRALQTGEITLQSQRGYIANSLTVNKETKTIQFDAVRNSQADKRPIMFDRLGMFIGIRPR